MRADCTLEPSTWLATGLRELCSLVLVALPGSCATPGPVVELHPLLCTDLLVELGDEVV
jgi:hypothetical protein